MNDGASAADLRQRALWASGAGLFALFAFLAARGSVRVQLDPSDLGPWAVPKAAAVVILLCCVAELLVGLKRQFTSTRSAEHDQQPREDQAGDPPARLAWSDLAAIVGILAYAPLIRLIGFTPSTLVLVPWLMGRLGSSWRWWQRVPLAVLLVLLVRLLFGYVFQVPMPELIGQ